MMEVDEVVISDGSEGAEIQNHPQAQTQPASEQPQPDVKDTHFFFFFSFFLNIKKLARKKNGAKTIEY
jgi:hypothetical protein